MATAKKSSKSAAKRAARKAAPGKAAKKAPAKKTPKKAARKAAPRKAAPRKAAPRKAAKKAPAKKTPKKAARKAAPRKAAKKAPARKAAPRKVAKKAAKKAAKSPFGKKFLDEMKDRLIQERAKYLHSEESYRAEAEALIEGREPGDVQFDEESGEGDTLAVERERDLALSAQARAAVEQIDAALDRIAAGTYGVCVTSGRPIPQERLRAIPWAAERVEYKVGGLGRL